MMTRAAVLLCLIAASQAFAVAPPKSALAARRGGAVTALSLSPGGQQQAPPPSPQTVISALRSPPALYEGAVAAGSAKAAAPFAKIFKLGAVAGVHIAFGAYLMLAVGGACPGVASENPGLQKLILGAIGLPTGLIMTLVTGAELFTGNTALVSAAYMEGKATRQALVKNWVASYLGNFAGSLLLAYLAYKSGTLGAGPAAVAVATGKCSLPWDVAFIRGILCNWLVCMAVYMASGCSTMIGKMSTY